MNNEFLERIKSRREVLEGVKLALKDKFIGIDDVIDKIIDSISLWYLTPELQFRPLIVSLWGITGVGKTDLVRNLVKLLKFTDKFIEIQMDMKNDYSKNIENFLESSGIDSAEPAILLLDEIQRYRTVAEDGSIIDNKYFNDIWMLLSDGKFQNNSQRRAEILELLFEEMYYTDRRNNEDEDDEASDAPPKRQSGKSKKANITNAPKKEKSYKFKTSYWTANRFKKMLNLKISAEEIMKMSVEQRMEIMEDSLKLGNVNEGKTYEKMLIFISGNLDEAFTMAEEVEDSERDADIYHELSKRINIIHIKNALSKQFKPEQIARFGNNHVIYPCLDKKSYYEIIKRNCAMILNRVETEHNLKITLSDAVYDAIYRNGVFPTQGVRPAISTVYNLLGSNLPTFLYLCLVNDLNKMHIDIKNNFLFTKIKGKRYEKEVVLDIDNIRDRKTKDEKILVTVHEVGHALLYAILYKTPPKQINVNSSGLSEGFVINHSSIENKTFLRSRIAVYLGGLVAEELVFGEEFKSIGAHVDISNATDAAGRYVRNYAMDGIISRIIKKEAPQPQELNYDTEKTDDIIENILIEEKKRAKDLLNQNMGTYKLLVKYAVENNGINVEHFLEICNANGLKLKQTEINDKLSYSYDEKVTKFLNQ
ncbi:MAG: AAA family ATPase [Candidatus Paceibacterota bacterium]